MYCNQCGRKLSEDAFFCSNCGTPVSRQGLITPQDDDMFEDTMIFSQDEMDKALAQSEKKEAKPVAPPEEPVVKPKDPARPAWLDEKDDPAIYENVTDPDDPSVGPTDQKTEKPAALSAASASVSGFFKKMQSDFAENKKKRESNAAAKHDAVKLKEKQRTAEAEIEAKEQAPAKAPLFKMPKRDKTKKSADQKPVNPEEKEVTETFLYMYVGVVIVGLIIGVILGLFIIRPWQTTEEEAIIPPAAVVQMAPIGNGTTGL